MTRDTDRPRGGKDKPRDARPRSTRRPSGSGEARVRDDAPARSGLKRSFGAKPPKPEAKTPRPARASRPGAAAPAKPARRDAPEPVATIAPVERQRIAKLMARVGLCSRRDAESWIVEGRVTLNGKVLTSPAVDVGPEDTILVDGVPLPAAEKTRLFLFHKPRGLVTSDRDPEGRETVASYLAEHWPEGPRVVTIGRLDINTEGLLLLTNDGGLARVLELPATGWVRRYRVRAKGETDQGILDGLRAGIVVEGVDYAGIDAKLDRIQGANCWLTMGLREGKNREIKRVLEHLGLEVNRLIRLSFGPFQLLDLPEGKVEEVKTRVLRDQLGETLAAEAGVDFADAEPQETPAPTPNAARPARGRDTAKTTRRDDARPPRGERTSRPPQNDKARSRRRLDDDDEVAPIRERPQAGARRHVSTLRTEKSTDLQDGPRKRIERGDTRDRKDRRVVVERLVSAREMSDEAPRPRRGAGRVASREGEESRRPARGHASPSALAKRERIARSGGAPRARTTGHDETRRGAAGDAPSRRASPRATDRSADKPWRDGGTRGEAARPSKPSGFKSGAARSGPRSTTGKRDGDARPASPRGRGNSRPPSHGGAGGKPSKPRGPKR